MEPSGRARNLGAGRTTAAIVLFVDDDAVLGDEHTIENLLPPFSNPGIAAVRAAKLMPRRRPGSSARWQGRCRASSTRWSRH